MRQIEWEKGTFLNISNKNVGARPQGKKINNSNNINSKEQINNDNTNKLTKKKKTLANCQNMVK